MSSVPPSDHAPAEFRLRWFPSGDPEVPFLLLPKDLAVAATVLRHFPESGRRVVEIGVYKGWWSIGVIRNVDGATVVGIDPYPGDWGAGVRAELESGLRAHVPPDRFQLYATRADAEVAVEPGTVALVHVDGEHTEEAAEGDLVWAARMLADDGLIVMDDYRNAWWPGLGSAMHGFLRSDDFRVVLVTERKAYLSRASSHADWVSRLRTLLAGQSEVVWARHWREGDLDGRGQRPDILGTPLLLLLGDADVLPRRGAVSDLRRRLAPIAADLLPPILVRAIWGRTRTLRPDGRPGRR